MAISMTSVNMVIRYWIVQLIPSHVCPALLYYTRMKIVQGHHFIRIFHIPRSTIKIQVVLAQHSTNKPYPPPLSFQQLPYYTTILPVSLKSEIRNQTTKRNCRFQSRLVMMVMVMCVTCHCIRVLTWLGYVYSAKGIYWVLRRGFFKRLLSWDFLFLSFFPLFFSFLCR